MITNREIAEKISHRDDFTANSTSGERNPSSWGAGRLPSEWETVLRGEDTLSYIVYSYMTPIAWERADGTVVIPDEKYSVTTSKVQNYVRQGFDGSRVITSVEDAR